MGMSLLLVYRNQSILTTDFPFNTFDGSCSGLEALETDGCSLDPANENKLLQMYFI